MFLGGHTCVPVSCNMWRNTFYIPHMNNWPEQVETLNSCQGTLVNSSHTKTFTIWNLEIQKTETVAIWTSRNLDMWKSKNLKCGITWIWNAEIEEPVTRTTLRDKHKTNPNIFVKELLSCHLIQTYHNMKSGNPMSNFVGPICFHDQLFWSHGLPCPTCLIPYFLHPNVWSHMFPCLCFGPTCFHVQLVGLIFSHAQFVSSMFPRPTCWSHMLPCPICWSHIRPCPICLVP